MRRKLLIAIGLTLCLALAGCATSTPKTETRTEDEYAELYAAVLATIADYQSSVWDGEERSVLDGEYHVRVMGDYVMVKALGEMKDTWVSTLLNVHLPLEELLGQSDDPYFQSAAFRTGSSEAHDYWLSPSGVHCYVRGEDVASWQFDNLAQDTASLVQFGSFAPCVRTDDQLFYCAPDGEVELLIDGIIGEHPRINYSGNVFAVNDGKLAEYSCGRSDDDIMIYPIAENVTSAIPLGTDYAVIFACTDGNTYLVQNRDYETCYELLYGDPDIAYRYCLGQESPEFYWADYQALEESCFVDADGIERRLSDQEIIQQLLDRYCDI